MEKLLLLSLRLASALASTGIVRFDYWGQNFDSLTNLLAFSLPRMLSLVGIHCNVQDLPAAATLLMDWKISWLIWHLSFCMACRAELKSERIIMPLNLWIISDKKISNALLMVRNVRSHVKSDTIFPTGILRHLRSLSGPVKKTLAPPLHG